MGCGANSRISCVGGYSFPNNLDQIVHFSTNGIPTLGIYSIEKGTYTEQAVNINLGPGFGFCWVGKDIFVGGGCLRPRVGILNCYFIPSSTWTPKRLADLRSPRSDFAIAAYKNEVYIISGCNDKNLIVTTVEKYSFEEAEWRTLNPIPQGRRNSTALATESQILVMGGHSGPEAINKIERFLPEENQWETLGVLPVSISEVGVARVAPSLLLVFGDRDSYWVKTSDFSLLKGPQLPQGNWRFNIEAKTYLGRVFAIEASCDQILVFESNFWHVKSLKPEYMKL